MWTLDSFSDDNARKHFAMTHLSIFPVALCFLCVCVCVVPSRLLLTSRFVNLITVGVDVRNAMLFFFFFIYYYFLMVGQRLCCCCLSFDNLI